jgi:hypothetical protein
MRISIYAVVTRVLAKDPSSGSVIFGIFEERERE